VLTTINAKEVALRKHLWLLVLGLLCLPQCRSVPRPGPPVEDGAPRLIDLRYEVVGKDLPPDQAVAARFSYRIDLPSRKDRQNVVYFAPGRLHREVHRLAVRLPGKGTRFYVEPTPVSLSTKGGEYLLQSLSLHQVAKPANGQLPRRLPTSSLESFIVRTDKTAPDLTEDAILRLEYHVARDGGYVEVGRRELWIAGAKSVHVVRDRREVHFSFFPFSQSRYRFKGEENAGWSEGFLEHPDTGSWIFPWTDMLGRPKPTPEAVAIDEGLAEELKAARIHTLVLPAGATVKLPYFQTLDDSSCCWPDTARPEDCERVAFFLKTLELNRATKLMDHARWKRLLELTLLPEHAPPFIEDWKLTPKLVRITTKAEGGEGAYYLVLGRTWKDGHDPFFIVDILRVLIGPKRGQAR